MMCVLDSVENLEPVEGPFVVRAEEEHLIEQWSQHFVQVVAARGVVPLQSRQQLKHSGLVIYAVRNGCSDCLMPSSREHGGIQQCIQGAVPAGRHGGHTACVQEH
jgi:hypothetical protein